MEQLNWKRIILGGLLAGLIIDASEVLVNGFIFRSDWAGVMQSLNRPSAFTPKQMIAMNLWGFATGIVMMWLYASIRPRYGAGPKTAVIAGIAMWVMNYALGGAFPIVVHIYPRTLAGITILIGFLEATVAAWAGAAVYREGKDRGRLVSRSAAA